MGSKQKRKRERNKRARKRTRSEEQHEGPNSFTYGPVSFIQEGKAMMVNVDRDHPTFDAFHAAQKRQIDETPELTLRLREEIAELAAPFHAFNVLLPLWKYLSDGLFFEDEELAETRVELHSHTDTLDRYLYGERGLRPKAERPAQRIDPATRRLLEKIAAAGGPTSIEAQVMILEMDEDSRQTIAGCFEKLTAMVASDGQPHDATLPFQDDFAVTIHCVPAELEAELPERLRNHGARRAELSNLRRWLGLGILFEDDPEIRAMVVMLDPSRLEDP